MPQWTEVASALESYASPATAEQLALAAHLEIDLADRTPSPVAARILSTHLSVQLDLRHSARGISEGQTEYLVSLAAELGTEVPTIESLTYGEADGWVRVLLARRSARALRRWEPDEGDEVAYVRTGEERVGLVSSIGGDGTIYLRGVGQKVRPEKLTGLTRNADLRQGRTEELLSLQLSSRPGSTSTNGDRVAELANYKLLSSTSDAAIAAFDDALDGATMERPMQLVLETYPELFERVTTGHHGMWVLPQVQFSTHYMADFLIAGDSSAGMEWTLVELERPNARLFNRDGGFNSAVTHAIRQITDWREWLNTNSLHAQSSRRSGGLGLPYLRPNARALIVIGRSEDGQEDSRGYRLREMEDRGVHIRTYDWLRRTFESEQLGVGQLEREAPRAR